MKTEIHPGYILHSRPYRETSLILEVFSSCYGRISLVARGVKGNRRNQSLLLQPARKLNLAWTMRSELGTLTTVEDCGLRYELAGTRLVSCFYMNELLIRMLHRHETHPELYSNYESSMLQLEAGTAEDRVLRVFEKRLLNTLGYGLMLGHEALTGTPVDAGQSYFYQDDLGPVLTRQQQTNGVDISGRTLLALDREDTWDEIIARESKSLFRHVLAAHTGDRPLGSRELYRAYLKNKR